jgi:ribosome maturation factor RimP
MMSSATIEQLEAVLGNIAVEFPSIEVLKAVVRRERSAYVLAVTVDRENGVDTDLCEQLTRYIERRVDAVTPPIGPYTIEVASAGLDRPLLVPAHFMRFRGRPARIITSLRVANRVEFAGPIESADEAKVTIADRYAGLVDIPYGAIKRANLVYEPADDLKRKKR